MEYVIMFRNDTAIFRAKVIRKTQCMLGYVTNKYILN